MANKAVFSFYLPEELLSIILLRLPIKSLLVCTSVNKTWNSLIKSPAFFSSHLERPISRKKNDSELCLLQLCSLPVDSGTDGFFLRLDDQELSKFKRIHFHEDPDPHGFQVVASCNGLVYVMRGRYYWNSLSYQWMLWNPFIRKTLIITERQNSRALEAVGLGFDSKTGDYKVVSIVEESGGYGSLMVNLYSLKANSWKRLPDLKATNVKDWSLHREMAFVNGALHFVAFRSGFVKPKYVILGFDLADEIFREFMLPDCMANDSQERFISACGESLSVLWLKDRISAMEIWVMKEYGVEGSWNKVSTVRMNSLLDAHSLTISGLVFKKDSHLLLSFSSYSDNNVAGSIFSHDLKSHETKEISIDGINACYYMGNYVQSLLLLDGANVRPSEIDSEIVQMLGSRFGRRLR